MAFTSRIVVVISTREVNKNVHVARSCFTFMPVMTRYQSYIFRFIIAGMYTYSSPKRRKVFSGIIDQLFKY